MTTTVELIQLPCGACGEVLTRQIRFHAVDVALQHPCTHNRMRSVVTEYVRHGHAWQPKRPSVPL